MIFLIIIIIITIILITIFHPSREIKKKLNSNLTGGFLVFLVDAIHFF